MRLSWTLYAYLSANSKSSFEKELKEYFSGTGIKPDVSGSVKVADSEPVEIDEFVGVVDELLDEMDDIDEEFTLEDIEEVEEIIDELYELIG